MFQNTDSSNEEINGIEGESHSNGKRNSLKLLLHWLCLCIRILFEKATLKSYRFNFLLMHFILENNCSMFRIVYSILLPLIQMCLGLSM